MPERLLRQALGLVDGFGRQSTGLAWNYVDLDVHDTLLSFERPPLGAVLLSVGRARPARTLKTP